MRYTAVFSFFLERKAERDQMLIASTEKAKNLYKRELDWIRKQPRARGTKAKYRVDAFEEVKSKAFGYSDRKKIDLDIKETRQGNKSIDKVVQVCIM